MCSVCKERKTKDELIKAVKSKEDIISIDIQGKMPGRGAYICKNMECIQKAKKTRCLERAFKCKIGNDIYDEISSFSLKLN